MLSSFEIIRTDSFNEDFRRLVVQLDKELGETYVEEFEFYTQFNQIENLKHVVVIYNGGEALGCGAIKVYDKDTMEVKRMYTSAKSRGMGIGSVVLGELEKWAIELNKTQCILETGTKQNAAIGMYNKHGYRKIPNYGQYIGAPSSVCFLKTLK